MTRQHRLTVRQAEDPQERRVRGDSRRALTAAHQRFSSRKKQARLAQSTSTTITGLLPLLLELLASSSVSRGMSAKISPGPPLLLLLPPPLATSTLRRHMAALVWAHLLRRLCLSSVVRGRLSLSRFLGAAGGALVGRGLPLGGRGLAFACSDGPGGRRRRGRQLFDERLGRSRGGNVWGGARARHRRRGFRFHRLLQRAGGLAALERARKPFEHAKTTGGAVGAGPVAILLLGTLRLFLLLLLASFSRGFGFLGDRRLAACPRLPLVFGWGSRGRLLLNFGRGLDGFDFHFQLMKRGDFRLLFMGVDGQPGSW